MKVYNIAISGFACNAKSTLLNIIEPFFPENVECVVMGEAVRDIMDSFGSIKNELFYYMNDNDERCIDYKTFQLAILNYEIGRVRTANSLVNAVKLFKNQSKCSKHSESDDDKVLVILYDRSFFDNLAFAVLRKVINFNNAVNIVDRVISNSFYDLICIIRGVEDNKFIENVCMSDDIRNDTVADFVKLQNEFYDILGRLINTYDPNVANVSIRDKKFSCIKWYEHPYNNSLTPTLIVSDILRLVKDKDK